MRGFNVIYLARFKFTPPADLYATGEAGWQVTPR